MTTHRLQLDLNRAEGDLSVELKLDSGIVTDAKCIGTMYRGFEQILKGRPCKDGLVITPRVCGICGTAHSYAAVTALETAMQCEIAPNGTRIRNICLITEEIQSDARHAFLMFLPDLCNPAYASHPRYREICDAFAVMKGRCYLACINPTKDLLKIVATFGGQWPHSSYMLPGGVVSDPSPRDIVLATSRLDCYLRWIESDVLGCSLDRWLSNTTLNDVERWADENERQAKSALGLFVTFGRDIGLYQLGRGQSGLLSYGAYFHPEKWQPPFKDRICLRRSGFLNATTGQLEAFDPQCISEDVKYSWFTDAAGGKPSLSETVPHYQAAGAKYSWAKAPRYGEHVAEVGALAELVVAGDALMSDVYQREGSNVWSRQLARLHRSAVSLLALRDFLTQLTIEISAPHYLAPKETESGEGQGLVQAARGALGHWIRIDEGRISRYQIITPTNWNASPRDHKDRSGHCEQALIGTRVASEQDPVEIQHVIRSHDPCLVCAVHLMRTGQTDG